MPRGVVMHVKVCLIFIEMYPLSFNINMYILLTAIRIFLMLLVGRFCLRINAFHHWWLLPFFAMFLNINFSLQCPGMFGPCKEKLGVGHHWSWKGLNVILKKKHFLDLKTCFRQPSSITTTISNKCTTLKKKFKWIDYSITFITDDGCFNGQNMSSKPKSVVSFQN